MAAALAGRIRCELFLTAHRGHATELARQATAQGRELIIAAGGDGTVHEVAQGLAATDAVMGVMPLGSIMNVAHMLGIPRNLDAAARTIVAGHVPTMDLGRVGGRYFLEAAGVGLDAGLLAYFARLDERRLPLHRALRMVWRFIRHLGTPRLLINADGQQWSVRSPLVSVANGPYIGAACTIAPDAQLNDGLLDLTVFRDVGPVHTLVQLALRMGRRRLPPPRAAETLRVRSVRVEHLARRRLPVHADAVVVGATPVHLQVAPAALKVLVGHCAHRDRPWAANEVECGAHAKVRVPVKNASSRTHPSVHRAT